MKKTLAFVMALSMTLSLAACGDEETKSSSAGSSSKSDTSSKSGDGESAAGDSIPELGDLNDAMHEAFGRDDDVPYQFPEIETFTKWPESRVWEEMGVIDLTPEVMNNGEVYNGGDTYLEDYVFGFTAQCDTDDASFYKLTDQLWDAGFRGLNAGNGIIIEAKNKEQLMEDNSNYLYYRAFYEHNGTQLQVCLQRSTFNESFLASVYYAPSVDEMRNLFPEASWPSFKSLIGTELPELKGKKLYGGSGDGDTHYYQLEYYITDVAQADYDAYIQNLKDGKTAGIILDPGYASESWYFGMDDTVEYTTWIFVPEDYENYSSYVYISYADGVVHITSDSY